ncbi:hypothetical protein ERX46_12700 [Brumimicrobium glaciale]|uniref:Uncharacterized protein n=1 Tax=Brumimicrobium glaciale TaxID=200475 RepID=A0A4Q4KJN9_9FLAO|nr:hypothetical protein [Brumimicrobium glaciale]RYM32907.1 hypothetical protein ERX46_12700 [Brumimicrobium glaciale]
MIQGSKKQIELLKAIENFIINSDLSFKVEEDEMGDYLSYLTSKTGKQFTFEVNGDYVEFYGDRSHDLIDYCDSNYIEKSLKMIQFYLK